MTEVKSLVFIIDDDEDIRTSLSRALSRRGFEVRTFVSGNDFLQSVGPNETGCIVLDFGMPGINGLELQQMLNADGFAMPIIFITGHGGVPESVLAMKAGAIDFLEKPFRTDVLIDRIQTAFTSNVAASKQREKIQKAKGKLETLTVREMEIVRLIVETPSNTTSKEIARTLDISPRTVDHHRARILEKMQIKSIVELVDLVLTTKTP